LVIKSQGWRGRTGLLVKLQDKTGERDSRIARHRHAVNVGLLGAQPPTYRRRHGLMAGSPKPEAAARSGSRPRHRLGVKGPNGSSRSVTAILVNEPLPAFALKRGRLKVTALSPARRRWAQPPQAARLHCRFRDLQPSPGVA
jgi:hypothetical protein